MVKIGRFNAKIMEVSTCYETLNYVAEYVQDFLSIILGKEIKVPISVDKLLESLEIPIKEMPMFNEKDMGSIHFNNGKAYILMEQELRDYYLSNWFKLKCIAKYILCINDILDGKRLIIPTPETTLMVSNELLADMIASEIMLPYKQSMEYLMESEFFKKLNDRRLWVKYGETAIGYCINMEYPVEKKTYAYHHLIQTLDIRFRMNLIDIDQYYKFQKSLVNFLEEPYYKKES